MPIQPRNKDYKEQVLTAPYEICIERGDINSVLEMDLGFLTSRERQPFHISPEDRRELRESILPYWRGKTVRDRKKAL